MPLTPDLRMGIGKRAGLASGLLGMLCVLGELCFLLPDLLVTRDALPIYKAHIGLFRGILQANIFATFALGALGVALSRPNRRGLLGIALGVTALLMGGAQAEPVDIGGSRAFSAGLDYFVLELLVLGLIFVPFEGLFPLRVRPVLREGWQTDLKHFFVSHAGVQLLSFAALIPAQVLLGWAVRLDFQQVVAAQPLWLQFVEIVVAVDFGTYWIHRAFHQVPWLWSFHAIHHSSQKLDWLAGSRIHVVDAVVTRAVAFMPVFLLGFAPPALYAYLVFVSFHAVFIHANVRWRFPGLRWLIATPEYHHWHHTSDEEGIDKNFAQALPMWDLLFGTAHQPDHWPKNYGTVQFRPGREAGGQAAIAAAGGRVLLDLVPQGAAAAHLPPAAVEALSRNPNLEYVESDPRRYPTAQAVPYGIPMVQADLVAHDDANAKRVCIIDSGYFKGHEDLQDSNVTATTNSGTGDPFTDKCGHGTHVAGTGAALDNTVGVVGTVGTGSLKLHIVKVFGDDCAWTYSSNLIDALNKCRGAGSNVVSMSLGCSGNLCRSRTEEAAFDDPYNSGVLSVAAAGNDGSTRYSYPASYSSVISVAAIDSSKTVAAFSQKNDQVDLAAPGVGVLSTVPWLDSNTLSADGITWNGGRIDGAARTDGTSGALADGAKCASSGSWTGKVVLCQRGDISFADKVNNVKNGGGVAAAIYNNSASDPSCGVFLGTLGEGVTSTIPAISSSCADGAAALTHLNSTGQVVSRFTDATSGYEAWDGTSMATRTSLAWPRSCGATCQARRTPRCATRSRSRRRTSARRAGTTRMVTG